MSGAKIRWFTIFSLATIVLLVFALGSALAEDKKTDEPAATQEEAAPAANAQTPAQPAPPPAQGRRPQVSAGKGKPGAPAQAQPQTAPPANQTAGPRWRRTPVPGQSQTGAPPTPTGRSNPYLRRGDQPQPQPQTTPAQPQPGYRSPYRPPAKQGEPPAAPSQPAKPDRWQRPAPAGQNGVTPERPQPKLPNAVKPRPAPPERNVGVPPKPENRRLTVPQATFRGPEAEKRVTTIPAQRQTTLLQRLRTEVRQKNLHTPSVTKGGRIQRDVVGNLVPRDARLIQRSNLNRIKLSYTRVQLVIGAPTNYYTFIPRGPKDYWQGYWDGYYDGYWDGRRYLPHPAVVLSFYYGYYWSDPYWFGFYYPGYYPSVYHYIGYCPGWIYPTRVYVGPSDYVYAPVTPYRYYSPGYGVDERGVTSAIGDIRQAWFGNDIDRIARHLTDELDVQVYFDGEYSYTTSTDDYYAMTADALATSSTVDLSFDPPIFISSHEVFVTGCHVFYDPDGGRQTVYVSYRLRRLGNQWYLVAIGTSLDPIRHQYRDFRYN